MPNVMQHLWRHAAERPGDICIRDSNRVLSWVDFTSEAERLARSLASHDVGPHSVVAAQLNNSADLILLLAATWRLGAAMTPINPALTAVETEHQIADAGALVYVHEAGGYASTTATTVTVDDLRHDSAAPLPEDPADGLALLIYTSGTTGKPKGVMLDHANLESMTSSFIEWFDFGPSDHSLLVLPLFHANGIVLGTLSPLLAGGQVTISAKFSKDRFFTDVATHRPTYFSSVPAILTMLTELELDENPDTSSLRFAICGAAPMSVELIERFEKQFGIPVVEGYGLSESTCAATINPVHGPRKPGTVGPALPGQRVDVIGADGELLPRGETGEVVIAGENVMRGYLGMPEATATTLVDGWLRTGDIGYLDDDGYLVLVDRVKDMIIRGGENIYPKEIESVLYELPDVLEAAVVGRPDPRLGEIPVAFVVVRRGATVTVEQITNHLTVNLSAYKRPVDLTVLAELPKNSVGKIDKRSLRDTSHAP